MKKLILILSALFCVSLIQAQAPKYVLLEDYTGTWCGFCPRAKTSMENVLHQFSNVIGLTVHINDGMETTYTSALQSGFNVTSFPNGTVDRFSYTIPTSVTVPDYSWISRCTSRLNVPARVAVSSNTTYNATTRQLSVTVSANFVDTASGDLRINCLIVEDSIIAPGDPQSNYYGNGCSNPNSSLVWYNYPCYISNYVHDMVSRVNLANDPWGSAGTIPASVSNGQNFTKTYTYTLPAFYNANQIYLVAFVSRYGTNVNQREILNSSKEKLIKVSTGISENSSTSSQIVVKQNAPNPFSEITAIQFQLNSTDYINVSIYDVLGNKVNTLTNSKLISGEHTFYWAGDDEAGNKVAPGVYYYRITSSSNQVTKPMIFIEK